MLVDRPPLPCVKRGGKRKAERVISVEKITVNTMIGKIEELSRTFLCAKEAYESSRMKSILGRLRNNGDISPSDSQWLRNKYSALLTHVREKDYKGKMHYEKPSLMKLGSGQINWSRIKSRLRKSER